MFQPIRTYHVIVSTYSTSVPWSRDESRLSIHIMWSIPQSRDVQSRKLKTIKYSVRDTCAWLSRLWVAVVACCVSSILMMHVLNSSESEWLRLLAVYQAYWWCLCLALHAVSGCSGCGGLLYFKHTNDIFPVCEQLQWFAMFKKYWWCLSLALQNVSGYSGLLCFNHTDDACAGLPSWWVAAMAFCVLSVLMMSVLDSPGCEWPQWLAVFHVN